MKGSKIIQLFEDTVKKQDPSLMEKVQVMAADAQMKIHDLHARAIACHCECMGMNAENMIAACQGNQSPFSSAKYFEVMEKWELLNEKGKPII